MASIVILETSKKTLFGRILERCKMTFPENGSSGVSKEQVAAVLK